MQILGPGAQRLESPGQSGAQEWESSHRRWEGALEPVEAPQPGELGLHSSPSWAAGLGSSLSLFPQPWNRSNSTAQLLSKHADSLRLHKRHGCPSRRLVELLHASRDRPLPPSLPGSDCFPQV